MNSKSNELTTIDHLANLYSGNALLRIAVQIIPTIGAPLDTYLSGAATQIHTKRIENFLIKLHERMVAVEKYNADLKDEGFLDLMLTTFEKVAKSRSEGKRERFANLITHQVIGGYSWDEAETALRLLSELEDIHIEILDAALSAPSRQEIYEGSRVISLVPFNNQQLQLENATRLLSTYLPNYDQIALILGCTELFSKGLLKDIAIGTWDGIAMQHFAPTELAEWFKKWIINESS